ncbi:hypothetical protein VTI74DRAFT_791 [Chaetomium olivicolor]
MGAPQVRFYTPPLTRIRQGPGAVRHGVSAIAKMAAQCLVQEYLTIILLPRYTSVFSACAGSLWGSRAGFEMGEATDSRREEVRPGCSLAIASQRELSPSAGGSLYRHAACILPFLKSAWSLLWCLHLS